MRWDSPPHMLPLGAAFRNTWCRRSRQEKSPPLLALGTVTLLLLCGAFLLAANDASSAEWRQGIESFRAGGTDRRLGLPLIPQVSSSMALRLRGGRGSLLSRAHSTPRSWPPDYEGRKWGEVAGKVININGTDVYHYEYKVGKRKAVQDAIERFKEGLRKRGVPAERIETAKDKPRRLERMLDEAIWLLDILRKRGNIPKDFCTPELGEARRNNTEGRARSAMRKAEKIRGEAQALLEGRDSAWFDLPEGGAGGGGRGGGTEVGKGAGAERRSVTDMSKIKGGTRDKEGVRKGEERKKRDEGDGQHGASSTGKKKRGREGEVVEGKGGGGSAAGAVGREGEGLGRGGAKKARKGVEAAAAKHIPSPQKSAASKDTSTSPRPKSLRGGGCQAEGGNDGEEEEEGEGETNAKQCATETRGEAGEQGSHFTRRCALQAGSLCDLLEEGAIMRQPERLRGGRQHKQDNGDGSKQAKGNGGKGETRGGEWEEDADSLCARGMDLYEGGGDLDEAEHLYEAALALNPRHVASLCNYALLLETAPDEDHVAGGEREAADLDKAETLYARALEAAPDNVDVLYQHALFLKVRCSGQE